MPVAALRLLADLGGLLMPRRCAACDGPLLRAEHGLCETCEFDLPRTRFHDDPRNPVEQLFWGKAELQAASAFLQFNRAGKVQHILHRLKYKGDLAAGRRLGQLMAESLKECERFKSVDTVMAVPLHTRKERMRGFNQSQVIVDGMREVWPLRSVKKELVRVVRTPSQTKRGRLDRWRNVKEAFVLAHPEALQGAHVLIVDDVVTTGATLEGCILALAHVPDIRVSVFTAACA